MEWLVPANKVSRLMGLSKEANLGMSIMQKIGKIVPSYFLVTNTADKMQFLLQEVINFICFSTA